MYPTVPVVPSAFRILLRSGAGLWVIAGMFCFSIYSAWVLSYNYNHQTEPIIASFLAISFCCLFSYYSRQISRRESLDLRIRKGWRAFSFAGISYALGEVIWFYYESIRHESPFVTIGDIFYLLFYPALLAGVLLLPPAPAKKEERFLLWLDLGIIVTTTFTVVWYFVLAPLEGKSLQGIRGIVAISYPIGSVLIISAILALLKRDPQKIAFWPVFFLGAGMVCSTLADALFAYFRLNEIPHSQAHLNVLWIGCLLFLLIGAACQDVSVQPEAIEIPASTTTSTLLRASIPYVFTMIGIILVLLVMKSLATPSLHLHGILLGTLLLFALVLVRQGVLLRENIRLYERTQYLANTDPLTSVYNRLFCNNALRMELQRSARYKRPLSVLLIDLDEFKKYNDTFGHLQGDEVLKAVAQTMNSLIRSTDVLGRFGGDEFLVVLPETDFDGARAVADKMKSELSRVSHQGFTIGVTIGIGTHSAGQSAEQVIEQADQHLYRLKHSRA